MTSSPQLGHHHTVYHLSVSVFHSESAPPDSLIQEESPDSMISEDMSSSLIQEGLQGSLIQED